MMERYCQQDVDGRACGKVARCSIDPVDWNSSVGQIWLCAEHYDLWNSGSAPQTMTIWPEAVPRQVFVHILGGEKSK